MRPGRCTGQVGPTMTCPWMPESGRDTDPASAPAARPPAATTPAVVSAPSAEPVIRRVRTRSMVAHRARGSARPTGSGPVGIVGRGDHRAEIGDVDLNGVRLAVHEVG